ncbi:uncharacterized protein TNCV_1192831 [Trichonephila clavipes]|nr:uncharacterized protein TNCV_1192831 [Trichonephila clavipes]
MACDAEDCGFQMLNDDEIMTSVQEESDAAEDETDKDEDNNNNESSKSSSNADTLSALETAMEWYEQQSECCPTQLLLLKRIRDLAAKKRRCTMIQRKRRLFSSIKNLPFEISDVLTDDFSDEEVPANNLLEFSLSFTTMIKRLNKTQGVTVHVEKIQHFLPQDAVL